uniref:Calponin-homology (CH) domain-containing protein n=1 Tax=Timema monikensis TaxID=170555 RepID=A0A7R9E2L4_9NEOP|nr:unnamed protein product [Timema monikensis]
MWSVISKFFNKNNLNLKSDHHFVDDFTMDRGEDRRRINSQDLDPQDTYDTRQAKQRASVKWLLSKAYNNKVPDNLKEPFYRDHEDQEHLKPQIVHSLANAELYCLALSNIYSDPNYHNLNHCGIIQALARKGVLIGEPSDAQLTETVLIQTTPIKLSAHMAVIEAIMVLYAKEVVTPDRVVAAIQRFSQVRSPPVEPLPSDHEDGLLLWVNKACCALRQKIEQELNNTATGADGDRLYTPDIRPLTELKDLCNGVCLAALISFYCPEELPWTDVIVNYFPTISDSVQNLSLVYNFCNRCLPSSVFHMMPEDVTYLRGSMKQNLLVFLADLFNVLEIHPVKCVRYPGTEKAAHFKEVYPRNSQGVAHKRSFPQSISAIPDLRSNLGAHSSGFTVPKSTPALQTSLPIKKSQSLQQTDTHAKGMIDVADRDDRHSSSDEQFVVHRGRGVPTLSSVVNQSEEHLLPARLRPAKEKQNQDSKAEERGEPVAAGRPSNWEDTRRSSYAGRRSRRNSVTDDSQLTVENFGGSEENLQFLGRNPDKEVAVHVGRKTLPQEPTVPIRTNASEAARSSGLDLIFQDNNGYGPEKRDEEKVERVERYGPTVSLKEVLQPKLSDSVDGGEPVNMATSFAELSTKGKVGGDAAKAIHIVYMQQEKDEEGIPPPKPSILNKKPIVATNGGEKKTSFAALPNNTTTWQQQSSTSQLHQSETPPLDDPTNNNQVMATQLHNIRMKLEEKRRRIESEKRRMEVVMSKQRQKVGKAAFLQAVTKGKGTFVKSPESDSGKDSNGDVVDNTIEKPQRPFSLQPQQAGIPSSLVPLGKLYHTEISEDVSSVEHKWLDGSAPFVEERKTPDIENMDLEQYQQSLAHKQLYQSYSNLKSFDLLHWTHGPSLKIDLTADDEQIKVRILVNCTEETKLVSLTTTTNLKDLDICRILGTSDEIVEAVRPTTQTSRPPVSSSGAGAEDQTWAGKRKERRGGGKLPRKSVRAAVLIAQSIEPTTVRSFGNIKCSRVQTSVKTATPLLPPYLWNDLLKHGHSYVAPPPAIDSQAQFYLHEQQGHRRTWAQSTPTPPPRDMFQPADTRLMWGDSPTNRHQTMSPKPQPQPSSYGFQPQGGFILHESKPGGGGGGDFHVDPRYHNGDYRSLNHLSGAGGYQPQQHQSFQLHSENSSPQHRGGPHKITHLMGDKQQHHHVPPPSPPASEDKSRSPGIIHAPLPTPPVDDMEPQSISFIGKS